MHRRTELTTMSTTACRYHSGSRLHRTSRGMLAWTAFGVVLPIDCCYQSRALGLGAKPSWPDLAEFLGLQWAQHQLLKQILLAFADHQVQKIVLQFHLALRLQSIPILLKAGLSLLSQRCNHPKPPSAPAALPPAWLVAYAPSVVAYAADGTSASVRQLCPRPSHPTHTTNTQWPPSGWCSL